MRFKLILASVKADITDPVVDAAKEAGATGATIIPGRGTGIKEAKTFFGLSLEAQTDIILLLVEEHLATKILDVIKKTGKFHEPGTGIAFVIPVEHVVGLESQMEEFKKEVRKSYF
ncbi:MAG: P-II family nitrogen regulator [Deltaproteobacteria bacterium]|nr:MAG: P-II family nitrogen regulator [Deltaproteobacteria bacterium]RLC25325.1 MAG: P-II family nitrogen regulator [Deltaproteobacteria bacterium]